MPETYVLDANAFIEAKKRFYPFDVCPGYWKAVLWHRARDLLTSVDRVCDEIEEGHDDLWEWVQSEFHVARFASTDDRQVLQRYGEMIGWVFSQTQFKEIAKAEFAQQREADAWIAAFAKAEAGRVVVTLEERSPDAKRRVPLPNVCEAFGIECITPYEMLRRIGVRLDWTEPV